MPESGTEYMPGKSYAINYGLEANAVMKDMVTQISTTLPAPAVETSEHEGHGLDLSTFIDFNNEAEQTSYPVV